MIPDVVVTDGRDLSVITVSVSVQELDNRGCIHWNHMTINARWISILVGMLHSILVDRLPRKLQTEVPRHHAAFIIVVSVRPKEPGN